VTTRPADWSALGEPADPLPGDPEAVRMLAARLRATASAIAGTAGLLRRISADDGWKARAAGPFRDRSRQVAGAIERVLDRYAAATRALEEYHPVLRDCQRRADAALADARSARAADRVAARWAGPAGPVGPAGSGVPGVASRDLADARRRLDRAIADRDEAALAARARILQAVRHDGVHDTWRTTFTAAVRAVAAIAGTVATVCGAISLLVAWIPLVGPELAAGFAAVGTWATVVSLACHVILLVAGKEGMAAVLVDVLALVTAGLARSYGRLAEESAVAGRSLARANEAARLRASRPGIDRWAVYRAVNRATGGPAGRARADRAATAVAAASRGGPPHLARHALTGYRADVRAAGRAGRSLLLPAGRVATWRAMRDPALAGPPAGGGLLGAVHRLSGSHELAAELTAAARIAPDQAADPAVAAQLAASHARHRIAVGAWGGSAVLAGLDAARRAGASPPGLASQAAGSTSGPAGARRGMPPRWHQ
jgi:hypothetical protein